MMGLVLLAVRRWALPPGALMLVVVLTFNAVLMSLLNDTFFLIPAAALAGLLADLLHGLLKPSATRPRAFRLFALAVPIVFYLLYFFTLMRTGGIWWPIQLWTGVVLLAGIVGWSLSCLLIPPQAPVEQREGLK